MAANAPRPDRYELLYREFSSPLMRQMRREAKRTVKTLGNTPGLARTSFDETQDDPGLPQHVNFSTSAVVRVGH